MVLIFVILVLQCILMLWALLPTHSNRVMLGMEHCVLTLMNVLIVLVIVTDRTCNCHPFHAICANAVVSYACSSKPGYARNGTLGTDTDESADATNNCHPGRSIFANVMDSLPAPLNQVML